MTERTMTEGFRKRVLMKKFETKRQYSAVGCKMFVWSGTLQFSFLAIY